MTFLNGSIRTLLAGDTYEVKGARDDAGDLDDESLDAGLTWVKDGEWHFLNYATKAIRFKWSTEDGSRSGEYRPSPKWRLY